MKTVKTLKNILQDFSKEPKKTVIAPEMNMHEIELMNYNRGWNTATNRCINIIQLCIQTKKSESARGIKHKNKNKNKTKPLFSLLYKLENEYTSAVNEYDKRCDALQSNNIKHLLDIDAIMLLDYQKNIDTLRAKITGVKDSILVMLAENIDD